MSSVFCPNDHQIPTWKKILMGSITAIFALGSICIFLIFIYFVKSKPTHYYSDFSDTLSPLFNQSRNNMSLIPLLLQIPYTHLMFLTAHNAYASSAQGYVFNAQQNVDIQDQMQLYSARGLELDTYLGEDGQVYVCHSICSGSYMKLQNPFSSQGQLFVNVLKKVKPFFTIMSTTKKPRLDIHYNAFMNLKEALVFVTNIDRYPEPIEKLYELIRRPPVVTLFLEDYVQDWTSIDQSIEQSGLKPWIFTPEDYAKNNFQWPSLMQMIQSQKSIFIFSSGTKKGPNNETQAGNTQYTFYQWLYMRENMFEESLNYGQESSINGTFACERLRGGMWNTSLLQFHYHPMLSVRQNYKIVNSDAQFQKYIDACQNIGQLPGGFRNPNFVNIDAVDQGEIYEKSLKRFTDSYIEELFENNFEFQKSFQMRILPAGYNYTLE